jgi:hypothetical protein
MTGPPVITITRRELYERVWEKSVARVGRELGVWSTRLAKICERNNVPVPGYGYWSRSDADRKPLRQPLPDADCDWEITFKPSQPGPPEVEDDPRARPRLPVPRALRKPHRLIREARRALEAAWAEHGLLCAPRGCLDIQVSKKSLQRACRIMDTLIKGCEQCGWALRVPATGWSATIVNADGCDVRVRLVEALRQVPRELSETEKVWEAQCARPRKRPPYDLAPNGRLKLRIDCPDAWRYGLWHDGKRRRLEDMLDDVLASIAGMREAKLRADKARAAAEERRREQERLRLEEEERKKERLRIRMAEQARVDELVADAEAWELSRKIREYIAAWIARKEAAANAKITPGSEADKWIIWALAQADRLDPLTESPPSILDEDPNGDCAPSPAAPNQHIDQ